MLFSRLLFRLGGGGIALFAAAVPAQVSPEAVSFRDQVLPLLERRCAVCHRGEQAQQGFQVTSVDGLLEGGASGPAIVAGKPDESLLMGKIAGAEASMPPTGPRLTPDEVELIRRWIAAGASNDAGEGEARSERWWSLRPIERPTVPEVHSGWSRNQIDRFVLAKLEEKGLEPSLEADRRTLIRRVAFDLTGLPPTPEQIASFVEDSAEDAYEKLVDRLLDSPAYGERWGRHWLDVARFGESNGYEQNHLRDNAWPYRDWVIRSLNEDKPFNRMILEQLAGDQIAPGDPSVGAATGFLVAGPHDTVKIQNPEGEAQKRANHLDDMIAATASGFLGLTVHCARCHDHKFDPILTKDYYQMQAAFAGVWHDERVWATPGEVAAYEAAAEPLRAELRKAAARLDAIEDGAADRVAARKEEVLAGYRPSVDPVGTEDSFEPVEARFLRLTIEQATARRNYVDLDELEIWTAGPDARNVALEGVPTAGSTRADEASPTTYAVQNILDGKFDKRWISAGGMPEWVMVELPRVERIDRISWSADRLMGFGGRFGRSIPEDYRIEVSLDGESWKTVATSQGRLPFSDEGRERLLLFAAFSEEEKRSWEELEARRDAAQQGLDKLEEPARAFLGRFEQPAEPSYVMVRGNPLDKGEEVAPGSLSVLEGVLPGFELAPEAPEGQRRLALARWIASDDNPLTSRVIVNRVWMHHFGQPLVRAPSDFGLNGDEPTHPKLLDWLADRLVREHGWRLKPLHKEIVMSAAYRQSSAWREAAARVDGEAVYLWRFPPRRLSAEEVRDAILAVSGGLDRTMGGPGFRLYRYTVDNVATYYPLEEFGPATYRRAVYHQHARSVKPELLGQFDCPDTSLPAPKRVSTTTPLQALGLLNNAFTLDQARFFAKRVAADVGPEPAAQVERAWQLAFGRGPDEAERAAAVEFLNEQGLVLFSRALFNANEFVYVF